MIDNDTITLKNVRIFGTEDRECSVFIGVLKEIKPVISFTKTGIKAINLIPQYSFYDPSNVDSVEGPVPFTSSPEPTLNSYPRNPKRRNGNDRFNRGMSQSELLRNLPAEDEIPMSDSFDFEESNKLFDKEMDAVESAAPAYNKDNFFDNLQEGGNERKIPRRSYRQADIETFGKSSLEERNREYRQKNHNYSQGNRRYRRGGYYRPDYGNRNNQFASN